MSQWANNNTLPVTIDKSHLVTIGERLYSSSIELVRELVNNAYDADATEVKVDISQDTITVEDNGSGMDLPGLEQYFTIGSSEKLTRNRSPVFHRQRIGQFGIGKFATLSACERFSVYTQKGNFAASVTFDKTLWQEIGEDWRLPMQVMTPDPDRGDGTTVILQRLTKSLDVDLVRQKMIESVPLKAPNFSVYINGVRLVPRTLSGHRIPVLQGTKYGLISGEIVIVSASQANSGEAGIEIKVKQATIKRSLFGTETWGRDVARIRGEVHADFLPITSDRTGFVVDSAEYAAFQAAMSKVVDELRQVLTRLAGKKTGAVVKRAVREALDRVARALTRHPDLSPFGAVPVSDGTAGMGEAAMEERGSDEREDDDRPRGETTSPNKEAGKERKKREKRAAINQLTPDAVVQKLRLGGAQVSCCIDSFGPEGPEVFTEGTIIYINRDHPLYQREMRKKETHVLNLARLVTQEISMMKDGRSAREAFEHQSILLRDAFLD